MLKIRIKKVYLNGRNINRFDLYGYALFFSKTRGFLRFDFRDDSKGLIFDRSLLQYR